MSTRAAISHKEAAALVWVGRYIDELDARARVGPRPRVEAGR